MSEMGNTKSKGAYPFSRGRHEAHADEEHDDADVWVEFGFTLVNLLLERLVLFRCLGNAGRIVFVSRWVMKIDPRADIAFAPSVPSRINRERETHTKNKQKAMPL